MRISDWSSDVCSSDLVIVGEENQAPDAVGDRDLMESFAAKRGPDRNPEQDHRGDRSLDPFRETKDRRRCAQHYGCALGTAERHPWVGEIAGAPRIVPEIGRAHV